MLLNQQPPLAVITSELGWQKGFLVLKTLRKVWVASGCFRPLFIPSNSAGDAEVVHAVMQGEKPVSSWEKENPTKTRIGLGFALTHCSMQQMTDSFSIRIIPSCHFFSPPQIVCVNRRYHVNKTTETANQNKQTQGSWETHKDLGSN